MPAPNSAHAATLQAIQPIVLVGGASARFGRNKLLEPLLGGELLVDRPIRALRAVFGPRVALVGACDDRIAARGDLVLVDRWPGMGPAGGIASALAHFECDVFVLAGDLPAITEETVRSVLTRAAAGPEAAAVLACVSCPEPCIGLYRQSALAPLLRSLSAGENTSIVRRLEGLSIARAPAPADEIANANTPEQLRAALPTTRTRGAI